MMIQVLANANTNTNSGRRVKKNNVIVCDESDNTGGESKPDSELLNGHHDPAGAAAAAEFDFTVNEEEEEDQEDSSKKFHLATSSTSIKEFSILTNPINYKKQTQLDLEQAVSNLDEAAASPESTTSDKASTVGGAAEFDSCNLIPINSASFNVNNSNLADTLSSTNIYIINKN